MAWEIIKAIIIGTSIIGLILIAEAYIGMLCFEISNKLHRKFWRKFHYTGNSALFFTVVGIFIFVLINVVAFLFGFGIWLTTK